MKAITDQLKREPQWENSYQINFINKTEMFNSGKIIRMFNLSVAVAFLLVSSFDGVEIDASSHLNKQGRKRGGNFVFFPIESTAQVPH